MDFIHKMIPFKNASYVVKFCDCEGPKIDPYCCKIILPPPPPPPASDHAGLSTTTIVIIAVICSLFLISSYYVVLAKFCIGWRRLRAPPAREGSEGEGEGEGEEEEDEIVDNPVNYVWYINTVGLEQSLINAITMCKYKKGDGLIEGTECSVCLSEFEDDEDLRLLPKCSHAFHVGCIDTWLRSHVNCPLCRAPIVSNPANGSTSSQIPHESDNPVGVPRVNVQSVDRLDEQLDGQNLVGELPSEVEREDGRLLDAEAFNGALVPGTDSRVRVLSDLEDDHRTVDRALEISGDELQPVRRSVSMDSSAASKLHMSLAGELLIEQDREKKASLGESSRLKRLGSPTKYGRNSSFAKIVGNGGKGSLFVNRLVAMKRSHSSSGNFFSSKHGRNRNSILPL